MILAFTVDPVLIYDFQNNLIGKTFTLLVLLYLTINNVTLGLLFALTIILILSRMERPIIEGLKMKKNKKVSKAVKNAIPKKAVPKNTAQKNIEAAKKSKIQKNRMLKLQKERDLKQSDLKQKKLREKIRIPQKMNKQTILKKGIAKMAPAAVVAPTLLDATIDEAENNLDEMNLDFENNLDAMTNMNLYDDNEYDQYDEYDQYYYPINDFTKNLEYQDDEEDETNGVDRISMEETFRVRNPSTIPVSKEQFRVRELKPYDNINKYYGGMSSLV